MRTARFSESLGIPTQVPTHLNAIGRKLWTERHQMIQKSLNKWLEQFELTPEQAIYANLALSLAKEYEDKPLTATASELRRTVLQLSNLIAGKDEEVDPLAEMLRRDL
jgi:hypothetical protein